MSTPTRENREQAYTATQLLRVAKRQNNPKRSYLLINPLQAKHLPVSPSAALAMMHHLGERIATRLPSSRLLIAFAETATAIGGMAAAALNRDCIFLTTTREQFASEKWLEFREEHSHAVTQRLSCNRLAERIRQTDGIIFVDDEFSTGATVLNMLRQIRECVPELAGKRLLAASILNRMDEKRLTAFKATGIATECLLRLPAESSTNYEKQMAPLATAEAPSPPGMDDGGSDWRHIILEPFLPDPRLGLPIGDYLARCEELNRQILQILKSELASARHILTLGTEECMLPALLLGRDIETAFPRAWVFCHATTRSPIGIPLNHGEAKDYPIRGGFRLPSLYEENRRTYIYNLEASDLVLVLSDAPTPNESALRTLGAALSIQGCDKQIFLQAGAIKRMQQG